MSDTDTIPRLASDAPTWGALVAALRAASARCTAEADAAYEAVRSIGDSGHFFQDAWSELTADDAATQTMLANAVHLQGRAWDLSQSVETYINNGGQARGQDLARYKLDNIQATAELILSEARGLEDDVKAGSFASYVRQCFADAGAALAAALVWVGEAAAAGAAAVAGGILDGLGPWALPFLVGLGWLLFRKAGV
jgi:hypothetical protein